MSDISIRIRGIRETQAALHHLSTKAADKVLYAALRTGANITARQIRQNAPVKTGRLKKSIRVGRSRFNTPAKNGKAQIYVTVKKGSSRKDPSGAYYAAFVEHGYNRGSKLVGGREAVARGIVTKKQLAEKQRQVASRRKFGKTKQGIRYRHGGSHVQGKHFIQRAFDATKATATEIIIRNMESGTKRLADELGFKTR